MFYYFVSKNVEDLIFIILYLIYKNHREQIVIDMNVFYLITKIKNNC